MLNSVLIYFLKVIKYWIPQKLGIHITWKNLWLCFFFYLRLNLYFLTHGLCWVLFFRWNGSDGGFNIKAGNCNSQWRKLYCPTGFTMHGHEILLFHTLPLSLYLPNIYIDIVFISCIYNFRIFRTIRCTGI